MGFADVLGQFSGVAANEVSEKLLFNRVIGFRGIKEGVGCSTIVQSLACAFSARTNKSVCIVDTTILYPAQYTMLCRNFDSDTRAALKDWFSTDVPISERIIDTKYKHISLLGLYNRRITDAYTAADSIKLVDDTFEFLKGIFDVIIVDLGHEWSQINAATAIKCNKIFTVLDTSSTCVNAVTQSLNNIVTEAVPFSKVRDTIVNKLTDKGNTNITGVLTKNKLNVVGVIPFSQTIFELGTFATPVWGYSTRDKAVNIFNEIIDNILVSICNETPLEIMDLEEQEAIAAGKKPDRRVKEPMITQQSPDVVEKVKNNRRIKAKKSDVETADMPINEEPMQAAPIQPQQAMPNANNSPFGKAPMPAQSAMGAPQQNVPQPNAPQGMPKSANPFGQGPQNAQQRPVQQGMPPFGGQPQQQPNANPYGKAQQPNANPYGVPSQGQPFGKPPMPAQGTNPYAPKTNQQQPNAFGQGANPYAPKPNSAPVDTSFNIFGNNGNANGTPPQTMAQIPDGQGQQVKRGLFGKK